MFQDNLLVSSSRIKNIFGFLTHEDGCPETSVKNYRYTLCNFPQECRYQMYRMFHINCAKLQDLIIEVFLSKKKLCINICLIIYYYIATSTLIFQDDVKYCTVLVLANYLHACFHVWQTLLPGNCFETSRIVHTEEWRSF